MITFLASPKPFAGEATQNQYNAIRSWQSVHPDAEVILFGDSPGTLEACNALGARYVPDVDVNEYGTPLIHSIFAYGDTYGKHDTQCYVNADIILTPDVIKVISKIEFPSYLLVGQRIDLGEGVHIDVHDDNWQLNLKQLLAEKKASIHPPAGSDYFIYKRFVWKDISKQITIGRTGYDNYLIYFCRMNRIPVIDVTQTLTAIHQFHDYKHIQLGYQERRNGPEEERNFNQIRGTVLTLEDASYVLTENGLIRNYARGDWMREAETLASYNPKLQYLLPFIRAARFAKYAVRKVISYAFSDR